MKSLFFLGLFSLFFIGDVWSEGAFQQGELCGVEHAYVLDVVDRFEEIDSIAVVGSRCVGLVEALLEERKEALVVSFSQKGVEKGNVRHEVFLGDPLLAVMDFKNRFSLERFDVIFVTLPGEFREMLRLLYALKGVAHDQTLLIFTGVESEESHLAAWKRCIERGMIEETNSVSDGHSHNWKEGRYLFSKIFSDG